jgi:RNA polymerase sigma-70 factor (ECF subfamily)
VTNPQLVRLLPFVLDAASFHDALGRGDHRAAATWLVRAHAGDVLSLCRAIVRDATTAEDLAQDTFASAFGGLSGLRLESSPRTWLLAIARHRCLDHLRRVKRAPYAIAPDVELVELHPDDGAPLGPELLQRRDDVVRALEVLDEPSRALVMLRFRHGLEYDELAEVFGQKEGTIRMRLSRALAKMRQELEGELELDALRTRASVQRPVAKSAADPADPAKKPDAPRDGAVPSSAAPPMPSRPGAPPPAAAPPPAPAGPPPRQAPTPPRALPTTGAPPPPARRERSLWSSIFGRGETPPAPPAPPTDFGSLLAELDAPDPSWLAHLEAMADAL